MSKYQPVTCELHSQYEVWIMHKTLLDLIWLDFEKGKTIMQVMPVDIKTHQHEEFLQVQGPQSEPISIRLDRIVSATPVQ